jgi:two-component system response regulator FixJ
MPLNSGPVIVVEDDDAVRNSLKFALEVEGLTVRGYEGGAQVLAATDLPTQGCLVVDYNMPAMNGVDLVRRLRKFQVDLPAILITSNPIDVHRSAAEAGIRQVLEKPLDDSSLVDSIHRTLPANA